MEASLDDDTLTCVAPERTQARSLFLTCDLPFAIGNDLARKCGAPQPVPEYGKCY